jgi:hypothetical protein
MASSHWSSIVAEHFASIFWLGIPLRLRAFYCTSTQFVLNNNPFGSANLNRSVNDCISNTIDHMTPNRISKVVSKSHLERKTAGVF